MLSISKEQISVLDTHAAVIARERYVSELEGFAPQLTAVAKREGLERLVDVGWMTARNAGFHRSGTIRLWMQLQLALGVGFFQDPQFLWLQNWTVPSDLLEEDRAALLHFHAQRYLDFIRGPENTLGVEALERALEILTDLDQFEKTARHSMALEWVGHIHPQKCAFLGDRVLEALAQRAQAEAESRRLGSPIGFMATFGLMFAFGADIFRDPMYPWVTHGLDRPDADRRLADRAKTYLVDALRQAKEA